MKEKYKEAMKLYDNYEIDSIKKLKYKNMLKIINLNNDWHSIINLRDVNLIKEHINKGADVNNFYAIIDSPLYIAIKIENVQITKFLLSEGADFNAYAANGMTPLTYLYHNNNINFALEMGADINGTGKNGNTLLYYHIKYYLENDEWYPRTGVIVNILKNGANINIKNFQNMDIFQQISNSTRHGIRDHGKIPELKKIIQETLLSLYNN